jgi:hypothetical protein
MSGLRRLAGVGAIALGAALTLWELVDATYVVIATAIVLSVVWPIVSGKRRNMRLRKQITLVASITVGFWIFTTTALGFAESSGAEEGGGASSLVKVGLSGREMNTRDLVLHGVMATLALAAIAGGLTLLQTKGAHHRRRRHKSMGETVA